MRKLVIKKDKTIRQKVYHHIREEILKGAIAPKERLIEAKIAGQIGTSRTPVREALHNLELEKLVVSIPRVGYVVRGMDMEEVEQICEIRAAIEGLAIAWATAKQRERLIQALKKNIENQKKQISKGNLNGYVELDAQFHDIIARLAGSDRLLELTQTLRRHMLRYRIQCIYMTETAERSMHGHERIVAAIERGDSQEIAAAVKTHLIQARDDILYYVFRESDGDVGR
ncbi:MAG: putative HTH-type transcriptional regulator YdfH [Syntrophorhabdus sp. PtaB.Bin047]|nr:MAG: putative HTH-type transcriptional regulator YdfH [Syntrophorhabdus sp. PtaB.Bin047]